jgi:ribosomal protein S18 acetylase RimI-like enzyme
MNKFTIKFAQPEDRGQVAQFIIQQYLGVFNNDSYEYLHQLKNLQDIFRHLFDEKLFSESRHLMCIDGNTLIATAGIVHDPYNKKRWKLVGVYTLTEYQNQGIGTYMIKSVIDEAANLGATQLTLCTIKKQMAAACKLYEKLGFTVQKTIVTHKPRDITYVFYEKNIN